MITGVEEEAALIGPRVLIIEAVPGCPELNLICALGALDCKI